MTLVLMLVLAQVASVDVTAERAQSRTRGTIAATGGVSLLPARTTIPVIENFGLVGEVSSLFQDRFSVGAQLSVITNSNLAFWDFGVGVALNYALSDRWWLGTGLRLHMVIAGLLGAQLSFMVPLRAAFAFWGRAETKVTRGSMFLALELAPGLATPLAGGFAPMPPPGPVLAGSALLSLGYAWW